MKIRLLFREVLPGGHKYYMALAANSVIFISLELENGWIRFYVKGEKTEMIIYFQTSVYYISLPC